SFVCLDSRMPSVHIFCSVIDNFGDLGVCWRLARQLHAEHGADVTLLVDDLAAFRQLDSRIDPTRIEQALGGITLMRWHSNAPLALTPAALVIEGFACTLPENYRAQLTEKSVWINLDYLSAEAWVDDCHGLSSPHAGGASSTFWFPGFTPCSGGLLRETDLLNRLDDPTQAQAFWQRQGLALSSADTPRLSLFCYETASVSALLTALHDHQAELMICAGKALATVNALLPTPLAIGESRSHGASTLYALPMLAHADYDQLLAACDLNIIRGEDSFVRAQWAAKPMLWHIYPQDQLAHETKLAAWLDRVAPPDNHEVISSTTNFTHEQQAAAQQAWLAAQWAWVRNELSPEHVQALLAELKPLREMMQRWREQLIEHSDLATQLMRFYANQVEFTPEKTHPDKPL
ncbi:MAG: elongation factor P maturation arginine rhamnosyltransferase EarP, partial [Paraperlucidibaca sp.]